MDRALILSYLQTAEDSVSSCEQQIAKQRDVISSLQRAGQNATGEIALLREMENTQMQHIADRDRLRAEFAVLNAIETAKADASKVIATHNPRCPLKRRIRRTQLGRRRARRG